MTLGLMTALYLLAAPLDEGLRRYADLDYEGCVASLAPAVGRLRGGQRAVGELYLGLCLFALGDEPAARKHLELALRLDAQVKPPSAASPKESALFDEISRAVARDPKPAPPPKKTVRRAPDAPEEPAEPEVAVAAEPPPSTEPTVPEPTAEPAVTEASPSSPPSRWPVVAGAAVTAVSLGMFAGFGGWGVAQRGSLEGCKGACDAARVAEVDRTFWVADIALGLAVVAAVTTVILFLVR